MLHKLFLAATVALHATMWLNPPTLRDVESFVVSIPPELENSLEKISFLKLIKAMVTCMHILHNTV